MESGLMLEIERNPIMTKKGLRLSVAAKREALNTCQSERK